MEGVYGSEQISEGVGAYAYNGITLLMFHLQFPDKNHHKTLE